MEETDVKLNRGKSGAGLGNQVKYPALLVKKRGKPTLSILVSQKSLSFVCHSGPDPESIVFELDSCLRRNDELEEHQPEF